MKSLLFTFLTLFIFSVSLQAQTADEIIDAHYKATGGKDKWKALNSMYSEMQMDMGGMKLPIKLWQEDMKGMRVEFDVQGMTGVQVVTSSQGWSFLPFQGQTKPEPTNEEMLKSSQSQLDIKGQLLDYAEKGSSVEFLGEDEMEGVEVYKLKLTDKAKTETTFFFEKDTYLLLKTVSKATFQGEEMEGITNFSNYKEVEGYLMPFGISSNQMGNMELTKIEINPTIDQAIFEMPK